MHSFLPELSRGVANETISTQSRTSLRNLRSLLTLEIISNRKSGTTLHRAVLGSHPVHKKNRCEFSKIFGNSMWFFYSFTSRWAFWPLTAVGDVCTKEFIPAKKAKFVLCEYKFIKKVDDDAPKMWAMDFCHLPLLTESFFCAVTISTNVRSKRWLKCATG
jgi:hypothetical protein